MEKLLKNIMQLSKWYGIGIIIVYSFLMAEFFSEVNQLALSNYSSNSIFSIIAKIGFIFTILSGIVVWIIQTFLFHLTALLFNGHVPFKNFLFLSAYPYIIPTCFIAISILLLDNIQISNIENAMMEVVNSKTIKLTMTLINYSFIPYYLLITILVHYLHQIKYTYAVLSVAIPVLSIWGISELFKLI